MQPLHPASTDDIVAVDLVKVGHLATALATSADRLSRLVSDLHHLTLEAGADLLAVRAVAEVSEWCRGEGRRLDDLVEQVRLWEATGVPLPMVRWRSADHPSFADPTPARRAARRAVDAHHEHDLERLSRLLDEWTPDPIFALTLLRRLGPEGVLQMLVRFAAESRAHSIAPQASRTAIEHLGDVIANADRAGLLPFSVTDLVDAAGDAPGDPSLALWAVGLIAFGKPDLTTDTRVALVDHYVLLTNRLVREGQLDVAKLMLSLDSGPLDPRASVLELVADDPEASRRVLRERAVEGGPTNLDLLLPEWNQYGDDGEALGALLVAGTRPAGDGPEVAEVAAVALDVITWVADRGDHQDLPTLAHTALAQVALPYLGSFRPDHLGGGVTADPLPDLDERAALAFVAYAAVAPGSSVVLRRGALEWAVAQFVAVGGRPGGGNGYNEVGGVVGLIDRGDHLAAASSARDDDQANAADRALVGAVANVVGTVATEPLPLPVDVGVALASTFALDAALPPSEHELEVWRTTLDDVSAGQVSAELLALAAVWRHRHQNGLFDLDGTRRPGAVPPPPIIASAGSPTEDDVDAFLRWKESRLVNASPVGRLLDDLGASYGEAGRATR